MSRTLVVVLVSLATAVIIVGCAPSGNGLINQGGAAQGYVYVPQAVSRRDAPPKALQESEETVRTSPVDVLISAFDDLPQRFEVPPDATVRVIPHTGGARQGAIGAGGRYSLSLDGLPVGPATLEVTAGENIERCEVEIPASGTLMGLGPSEDADFFPTQVGNRWVWDAVPGSDTIGREAIELVGTASFGAQSGTIMQFEAENESGELQPYVQYLIRRDGNNVYGFAKRQRGAQAGTWQQWQAVTPEATFLNVPLLVGESWQADNAIATVVGRMDTTTPIGGGHTFPDAYVIEIPTFVQDNLVSVEWWWYAERFGFVGLSVLEVDQQGNVRHTAKQVVESTVALPY